MSLICIWPNDDWCEEDQLEEWLSDHSDDYSVINPLDYEEDDIELIVHNFNRR